MNNEKIFAIMTTIPEREDSLKYIVNKLINQVDELRVVFNNYEKIPEWTSVYANLKCYENSKDILTSNQYHHHK